jgi:RNA polymerase sigma factor (sigma-70 family)
LRDYQPIAPLESWVYGIVCLALKDAVRSKARGRRVAGDLAAEPVADGEQGMRRIVDNAEIERALTGLGGLEAQVLRLKYLEGLTFVELGERLGISPNTAKTLHYRGLLRLRGQLASEGTGEDQS